jgi:hypothetical protein
MSKPDNSSSTTEGFYSLDGGRGVAAEALGLERNLGLTEELQRVYDEFGPRLKPVYEGVVLIRHIEVFDKPCPPDLRDKLDAAIGRAHRIRIIGTTVDDWLETYAGLKIAPGMLYESWEVDAAIARYNAEMATRPTTPTKRWQPDAEVREEVEKAMRNQIENHLLAREKLERMTQREGAAKFGVSRETFVNARSNVLGTDQTGK